MLKGLAHACFIVRDIDAAIAFYEKLGCRRAFSFTKPTGELFGVYLHVGARTFIELFTGAPKPSGEPSYRHISIEVDDMTETVAHLRRVGIEVSDPKTGSDDSCQAWLADPDGNRIELHCYTDVSKQTRFLEMGEPPS